MAPSLLFKTHPTPVSRLERLGAAMGSQLDTLPNAADDTPGFVTLRNPPPSPPAAVKAAPRVHAKKR